ncbi:hypothetical protein TNCV_782061 [Trichonephila clavipes]|nr:hypothetical protein TNCV_782061 [Trichonephila clavipes]
MAETCRNITARVIERDVSGPLHEFLEESKGFRTCQHGRQCHQNGRQSRQWWSKMMPTWLYRQDLTKFSLNRHNNVRGVFACE